MNNSLRDFTNKCFKQNYKLTIGVDIFSQEISLNGGAETIYLSIWDINRSERFNLFRSSFYNGSVGALFLIDLMDKSTLRVAEQLIEEIRMSSVNLPIFLYGVNSSKIESRAIIEEEIENLNCIYIELNDVKAIWHQLANKMLEFATGKSINNPQYRAYLKSFKESKNFLQMLLKSLGYKVQGTNIDILNKHGLFTVNLKNGKTFFEPLECSDCKKRLNCKNKSKKFICIVQKHDNFRGWSNSGLLSDDILVLSKIYAISEDFLPSDVHSQMNQIKTCSAMK